MEKTHMTKHPDKLALCAWKAASTQIYRSYGFIPRCRTSSLSTLTAVTSTAWKSIPTHRVPGDD